MTRLAFENTERKECGGSGIRAWQAEDRCKEWIQQHMSMGGGRECKEAQCICEHGYMKRK
jgi:hypothetical protein